MLQVPAQKLLLQYRRPHTITGSAVEHRPTFVARCTRHCRGLLDSGHRAVRCCSAGCTGPRGPSFLLRRGGRDEANSDGSPPPLGPSPHLRFVSSRVEKIGQWMTTLLRRDIQQYQQMVDYSTQRREPQ